MTSTTNTADHRSLYEVTGDIKDINTMLVPRSTLAAPAQVVQQDAENEIDLFVEVGLRERLDAYLAAARAAQEWKL